MTVLFDLCCGSGGASVGYVRTGFSVIGFDIDEKPDYPFEFRRMNVLDLDYENLVLMCDAIHASIPCQVYSKATGSHKSKHEDLYHRVKAMLIASGKPYVIENVPGSPLRNCICLCGTQFGLTVKRHRLFESNVPLVPHENRCECSQHLIGKDGFVTVAGSKCTKAQAMSAMGINWDMPKRDVVQAIPPAYTEFIGYQLMRSCSSSIQVKGK